MPGQQIIVLDMLIAPLDLFPSEIGGKLPAIETGCLQFGGALHGIQIVSSLIQPLPPTHQQHLGSQPTATKQRVVVSRIVRIVREAAPSLYNGYHPQHREPAYSPAAK